MATKGEVDMITALSRAVHRSRKPPERLEISADDYRRLCRQLRPYGPLLHRGPGGEICYYLDNNVDPPNVLFRAVVVEPKREAENADT